MQTRNPDRPCPQTPRESNVSKTDQPLASRPPIRLCWAHLYASVWGASTVIRRTVLGAALLLLGIAGALSTQAEAVEPTAVVDVEPVELSSAEELTVLVAPVALYPDDLLAIVLPASTYPLQVVLASRFLDARETDPRLEPDSEWDASIVALLNYPEVVALLDQDLEWTWRLGEAVLLQQQDVIAAVADFRKQASAAGNLDSDERQVVEVNAEGAIEITPVEKEVIYVPYYDPEEVTVYQPSPAYHYYPRAYPVYYYPYPSGHYFPNGAFWGVTSAFSIGWRSHRLHWHHYGFHGHPYFGYSYYEPFYWRRPLVWVNVHDHDRPRRHGRRHRDDNRWYNDGRRGGARPPYRPGRRDRDGRPDGSNDGVSDDRHRVEPPGTYVGRGLKRTLVAMPDKKSGHTPVAAGVGSVKSPGNKARRAGIPEADGARPAAARNPRILTSGREPQGHNVRQLPSPATRSTHPVPTSNRRAAAVQRPTATVRPGAKRPSRLTSPQPRVNVVPAAKAPTRIVRKPAVKPTRLRSAPRVSKPVRKSASVQRPAVQPRQPATIRTPRRSQPVRSAQPPKKAPPRLQQRQEPKATTSKPTPATTLRQQRWVERKPPRASA